MALPNHQVVYPVGQPSQKGPEQHHRQNVGQGYPRPP